MSKYNKMPLKFIGVTGNFGNGHYGVDFGWNGNYGGPNAPIYSVNDGVVTQKDYNSSAGHYIWIETVKGNVKFLHRYLHMNEASFLKIGDSVVRGQHIGNMGNTGESTGNHLHLELWKTPRDYVFNWNDRNKYVVNPLDYIYLFDDQVSSSNVLKVLGTSLQVKRNTKVDQVEVINEGLRCRENHNGNILGYVDLGLYNVLETVVDGGYSWYKIGNNRWIANTEDVKFYKKDEEVVVDPCKEYKVFTAKEDGIYYINLKKDEKVLYK